MPALFANLAASRSRHISSQKIAQHRLKQNLVYPVILSEFFSKEVMMKIVKPLLILVMLTMLSGCVLTKIVSVPMRLGGAVISIVPVAGNTAHDAIDKAAEIVDDVPI
jgi:hypothetical protein